MTESFDRAAIKARARLEEWLNSTLGDVHIYPADVRTLLAALEEAERQRRLSQSGWAEALQDRGRIAAALEEAEQERDEARDVILAISAATSGPGDLADMDMVRGVCAALEAPVVQQAKARVRALAARVEEAERRIAAVASEAEAIRADYIAFWGAHSSSDIERVGRSPRMPKTPALDRERAALHPVAETTDPKEA